MAKVDVSGFLNIVRSTASSAYQDTVPMATADNIQDVGEAVIKAIPQIRNEFMTNLYNKVGLTLIDYPVVSNRFAHLKKGTLDYGQTIEDLYVGLAVAEPYITGMNEGEAIPDPFSIRKLPHFSAFYSAILARQYHVTRHVSDLRKAFHSHTSMAQFISGMTNAITSAENYDDMRMAIATMARQIEEALASTTHNGVVHLITDFNAIDPAVQVTADNAMYNQKFVKFFANQLKKWSWRLQNLRTDLNLAGVPNLMPVERQRLMMMGDLVSDFETELLAWAHGPNYLDPNAVDLIDGWYTIGADGTTPVVTPEDLVIKGELGAGVPVIATIYDLDMVKIYNKERIPSQAENAKGNYWNTFLSLEDIFAASPYKNFVVFALD